MLFSKPGCLFLLCLTAGVLQTNAVPDKVPEDGADNSLLPTFNLLGGNGGSETGRCTGTDLDNLKASYEDMCLMAQSARDQIDFLLAQASTTGGNGPQKPASNAQQGVDDWKNWERVRETYLSLFGSDPFVKPGDPAGPIQPGQAIPGHTRSIRNFYNRVATELCIGQKTDILLVCTDAHYQFVKIGSPDPGDPQGRNIEDTHPQCNSLGGVWFSPNMPQGKQYRESPPPKNPGEGPFCNGDHGTLAVTVRDLDAIFFCKDGLDTNIHKTITLKNLRNSVKPASRRYKKLEDKDTLLQVLMLGKLTKLEDVGRVGGEIMPVTWLHELHHLLSDSKDEPAVDEKGNRIKVTESTYNPATNEYEDEEVDKKAYGYDLAKDLALYGGISAMVNPDNSAFFALAMFFGDYDWSRGFAMPLKKP